MVPEPDGSVPVAASTGGEAGFEEEPAPEVISERPLTEIEVDSAAALDPSAVGPDYPVRMLEKNIEGLVLAQFVVDSLGRADTTTFKLLEPAEPDFVMAVKTALPRMEYRPASLGGRSVSSSCSSRSASGSAPAAIDAALTAFGSASVSRDRVQREILGALGVPSVLSPLELSRGYSPRCAGAGRSRTRGDGL